MASHPTPKRVFTEAEYLAMERVSERKHEYYRGEIFLMGGGTPHHNLISAGFVRELGNALMGRRGCRVFGSDQRVRVSDKDLYTYPDVSVVCGAHFADDSPDTLLNPKAIVEVLPDATENYDRKIKFDLSKGVSSLAHYVLASQDEVRVDHYARQPDGSWLLRTLGAGDRLPLEPLGIEVALDDVYAGVFDED